MNELSLPERVQAADSRPEASVHRKPYERPTIVFQCLLEARAGSPLTPYLRHKHYYDNLIERQGG